ncbi:hypothetical protein BJ165DRAFT_1592424 [Panaeolus papilionaceus]|nr:hypothetical protein BJ165DRAFT_1592424 [Panaeolus papilionaceus]
MVSKLSLFVVAISLITGALSLPVQYRRAADGPPSVLSTRTTFDLIDGIKNAPLADFDLAKILNLNPFNDLVSVLPPEVRQQFEELTEEDKTVLKELLLRAAELNNLDEALEAFKAKSPKLHEMALKILSELGFVF